MGTVIDRTRWPVVTVCVEHAGDLDELADGLDEILAAEESFAISVVAPRDIEAFQEMLWSAAPARRRLRRQRALLAAWCEAAAHVLDADVYERTKPSDLRYAELIWGCTTLAADCEENAYGELLGRLGQRPSPFSLATI